MRNMVNNYYSRISVYMREIRQQMLVFAYYDLTYPPVPT